MPHFLVRPKHLAWLTVLLYPLVWLYDQFLVYRDDKLKEATINSSVNRFTRALRDKFLDETIYIVHPFNYLEQAFVYLEIEGATIEYDYLDIEAHLPVDYDSLQSEFDSETDFIVRIPVSLAEQTNEVSLFVQKYAFYGKRFRIETF
ncbi:MAG: hypothetical protein IE931_05485 [Sphingobacteriales bacterium]|nr:hypothetical protein [Sphingobacteriales bacterium]